MDSLADLARRTLRREPSYQVALARGVLNARGLAKRLHAEGKVREEDIDSLANAIRECRNNLDSGAFDNTSEWLSATRVEAKEGLGAVSLERRPEVIGEIERLRRSVAVERGEIWNVIGDRASVTVILEGDTVGDIRNAVDEDAIQGFHTDLTSVELRLPDAEGASEAVLYAVLGCLRSHGLLSMFTLSSPAGISILMSREDGKEAVDLVGSLTEE